MNGIRIVVTAGETVGGEKEYFFPDSKETIVLGRDPARCDIVFAQHLRERGVGSEHLALRRSLGRYRLALNTENAVQVDGRPAFDEQELVRGGVLQLDRGATLRVEIVDERPQTLAHDRPAEQVGSEMRRARSWVRPALAGVVVLVLALGYVLTRTYRIESAALQSVPAEVIARTTQSVYLVLIRDSAGGETGMGTAWIGPGGRVITNAHVADIYKRLGKDQSLVIRGAIAPHHDHRVVSVTLHPGYELFEKTAMAYEPAERDLSSSKRVELIPVADVALMQVENQERLAAPLALLVESRVESLGAGEPVAFVGFPAEGLITGSVRNPVPISQRGQVINVTDSFLTHLSAGPNRVVLHSLPATGGASGSPIVNTAGQVVAVLNAGNVVFVGGKRTPSAAAINFAQRVDYVYDLLDAERMKTRTALYEREWKEGLKRFDRSQDLELKLALDRIRSQLGAKGDPKRAEERYRFAAIDPKLKKPAERFALQLQAGVYVWLAFPSIPVDLDMSLADAGQRELAKDVALSRFALLTHEASAPESVEVTVFQEAAKLDPKLEYTLQTYFWPSESLAPVEHRWIRTAKARLKTEAEPAPLVTQLGQETARAQQGDGGEAAFSVPAPGRGHILLVVIPRERVGVGVVVKAGDEQLGRAASKQGPTGVIAPVEDSGRELRVVVVSQQPGVKFDLRGYRWGPVTQN